MSISDNTTKINQLISKINDLPSAAPTVRRVESSFTVNYVEGDGSEPTDVINLPYTYVDCGFKPDVIFFKDFSRPVIDGFIIVEQMAVVLSELSDGEWAKFYGITGINENWYLVTAQPTDTGFRLFNFCYQDDTGETIYPEGEVYNYVAIKYT